MNHHTNRTKTLIITGLCLLALSLGRANAEVLRVPSDKYPTITAALKDAFAGDQIFVAAGRYPENITITVGVELVGAGQDKTTIVGTKTARAVTIDERLGIAPTVRDLTIEGGSPGISVPSAAIITNLTITNTGGSGIECSSSSTITNVTITNAGGNGIYLSSSSPTITYVTIKGSKGYGIYAWGNPIIRTSIITQNENDGVYVLSGNPDFGTAKDPGHNEIYRNRGFNVNNTISTEIQAIGNWWGSAPPNAALFKGKVKYDPWLTEPPISSLPTIKTISPGVGSVSGGTLIQITGSRFAAGATVMVGINPATGVSVDSETQITAITPAGTVGPAVVTVTNPDGKSGSKDAGFTYVEGDTGGTGTGIYQIDVALTKGVNSFSLPLRPETPITASQLAENLKSTIVIRVQNGQFDAYVHAGKIGTDFPIEAGKGYIVNLLEAKTHGVKGRPWGTEVPAAPSVSTPSEPWAFVVAGWIDTSPDFLSLKDLGSLHLCVTNLRTGENLVVPISPSGEFAAAFVDVSRRPVVAAGDEVTTQLISPDGVPLTGTSQRQVLRQPDLARAYLLTPFSAMPDQTRLLQNYPNPFNPETWIPFQLAHAASVEIEISDLNGHLIRHLDLGYRAAGWHLSRERAAYWDGRNGAGERVSSGVYFYRLRAGDFSAQRKLVVVK